MKTLAEWIRLHPSVIRSMFEKNYSKQSGSGKFEDVCGFCLASHRFREKPPILCKFCRAPIRETRSISDLPEVLNQKWRLVNYPKSEVTASKERLHGAPVALHKESARKLATLSPYEDKCWVFAFNYYLDRGKSEREAHTLAWRDLQLEFPRLRQYDGCRAS